MVRVSSFMKALSLELISDSTCEHIEFATSDLNRPGLQFSGFFDYFAYDRMQIIGKAEMTYLTALEPEVRLARIRTYMSHPMPCIVICRGMQCPDEFLEEANRNDIPVFRSNLVTTRFSHNAINYINARLAPKITRHAVLIDVYGIGIMITGESGIGKSECALELIKRGHQLVADDVVLIRRVSDDRLIGEAPETVRHFMEIRGIGIIDIRALYGISSVLTSKSIELVICLELWNSDKDYERLGLDTEYETVLGVRLTRITLPVRPGRNLAIIVEVAARNHRMRALGYNPAEELAKHLRRINEEAEE